MTWLAPPATWLAGYIPDLPTPFDQQGGLDLTAFAKLCERQIEAGVSAVVVGETSGEASTLTPVEHDSIVRAAVEIARGRARVIAGASSNSTSQAIELTERAEAAGADAVLCRPASTRISGQLPMRPRFRSFCTIFRPGPFANCPTTRWRGWHSQASLSD
jgi:hypothetical protein